MRKVVRGHLKSELTLLVYIVDAGGGGEDAVGGGGDDWTPAAYLRLVKEDRMRVDFFCAGATKVCSSERTCSFFSKVFF